MFPQLTTHSPPSDPRSLRRTFDVVVVGGGVIGLSIAWEVSGRGLSVAVLDQAAPGREASWAGAGMIPPGDLSPVPGNHELAVHSSRMWPEWTDRLRAETGIDNGYRRCGSLRLPWPAREEVHDELEAWRARGVRIDEISFAEVSARWPALGAVNRPVEYFPDFAQVRNPWHLRALQQACEQRGVTILPETPVTHWSAIGERILAASTPQGDFSAGQFVLSAGAWSRPLLEQLGISIVITPVRGQILLFRPGERLVDAVIDCGQRYLVPRDDGRILVGSTEEFAGFEKANTPLAISQLTDFATSILPALRRAELERAWSGLRPVCSAGRPLIGMSPTACNLLIATGHFRGGLSNSPATAQLARELLLGEVPTLNTDWFTVEEDPSSTES